MAWHYLMQGDCLERMREIPDGYIDLILCDLPYGTTQNKWDTIIPLEQLWKQYNRLCKGPIVLFAAQPFTSTLVTSNLKQFKYDWIWRKEKGTGHLNAKKMPMRDKEDVLVFGNISKCYNPQFSQGKPFGNKRGRNTESYGDHKAENEINEGKRYPKQVLEYKTVAQGGQHPTQKPTDLLEYFIKTYTNEKDVVLDNTMGSGSTGVACVNVNRNFVGIEKETNYFEIAKQRIEQANTAKL